MRRMLRMAVLAGSLAMAGCMTARPQPDRPDAWAEPVAQAQLPNRYRVDTGLSCGPVNPAACGNAGSPPSSSPW